MSDLYREEPVPLVEVEYDTKKLKINEDSLKILSSIKSPMLVVGVAGFYRTGKSYLLNRVILNRKHGFGVGSTIRAHTKGIWMWGKPIPSYTEKGELVNVIVLDSEGLGAIDQDSTHDCRIFALVLLLCSVFVYNSVGAIDENAISNLSLVINLTKHIHLKGSGDENVNNEEFANYFPSFLWVLRDFTLQLVDDEGEKITPRNYLENALVSQKGFSEEVEQKNRIRRLIQTFFKERDCFIMVRPLTNEKDLQSLEEKELSELRPEFSIQVSDLRKRILSFNKIKTLNNKIINGEILAGLLTNYAKAINDGAVPNIESAWNYICKNQCQKLFDECTEEFEKEIKNKITEIVPMSSENLKAIFKEIKSNILTIYDSKSIGDVSQEFKDKLKDKLNSKYNIIIKENSREFEKIFNEAMDSFYSENINEKLKLNKYNSFIDFEKDLRKFREYFISLEPNGPNKDKLLSNFIFQKTIESSFSFIKESTMLVNIKENEFKNEKERLLKEIELYNNQIEQINIENENNNSEYKSSLLTLENKLKNYEETIKENKTLNKEQEDSYKQKIEELKVNYKSQLEEKDNKLLELEKNIQEKEREIINLNSKFEKDVALYTQEIQYLKNLEIDKSNVEKNLKSELNLLLTEKENIIKELNKKYQLEIKEYISKNNELSDRLKKFENDIQLKEELNCTILKDLEDKEHNYISILDEKDTMIKELESKFINNKNELKNIQKIKAEYDNKIDELLKDKELSKEKIRELTEKIKQNLNNYEKEKAILLQENELIKDEMNTIKKQIEDYKKINEKYIILLEEDSKRESNMINIEQVKLEFDNKIKDIIKQKNAEILTLENEYNDMNNKYNNTIKQLNDNIEKKAQENLEKSLKLQSLDEENKLLADKVKKIEQSKKKIVEENENYYKNIIVNLEKEIDTIKNNYQEENKKIKQKNEENLLYLKNYYEEEKIRLESKYKEDKEKFDSDRKKLNEEFNSKLKKELSILEEENLELRQEISDIGLNHKNTLDNYENELSNKANKLGSLENEYMNYKYKTEKDIEILNNKLESNKDYYEKEKYSFIEKIEQYKFDINKITSENFKLKEKLENLGFTMDKITKEKSENINEISIYNEKLKDQLNDLKSENNKLSIELMNNKMNFEKELALSDQKNDFNIKKINELIEINNQLKVEFSNNLKKELTNNNEISEAAINNLKSELSDVSYKLEQKKSLYKNLQKTTADQINVLTKDNANLNDKIRLLESQKNQIEYKLTKELEQAHSDLSYLKDHSDSNKSKYIEENEKMKEKMYELEILLADIKSNADKNNALKDSKISYLSNQVDQLNNELKENSKNFDLIVQKYQEYKNNDKSDMEKNHKQALELIEQRYLNQVKDEKENSKNTIEYLNNKIKNLELELSNIKDTYNDNSNSHAKNILITERKINDLMEYNKQKEEEIMLLKNENEKLIISYNMNIEKEKDNYKKKLYEIEKNYKDLDTKHNNINFILEKERTRWNFEKENFLSNNNDLIEKIKKMENQLEYLQRENEKYKYDIKNLKKNNLNSSANLYNFAKNFNNTDKGNFFSNNKNT